MIKSKKTQVGVTVAAAAVGVGFLAGCGSSTASDQPTPEPSATESREAGWFAAAGTANDIYNWLGNKQKEENQRLRRVHNWSATITNDSNRDMPVGLYKSDWNPKKVKALKPGESKVLTEEETGIFGISWDKNSSAFIRREQEHDRFPCVDGTGTSGCLKVGESTWSGSATITRTADSREKGSRVGTMNFAISID